jgi:DmsE family decaheme c-type cytochrome
VGSRENRPHRRRPTFPGVVGLVVALYAAVAVAGTATGTAAPGTAAPGTAAPAYSDNGADTCLGCHANAAVTGIFHTRHGRPNDPQGPFGAGGLQCEACHGPGGAHVRAGGGPLAGMVDFGRKAGAPARVQNAKCLACHQQNAAHAWGTGTHAANEVACASCHRLHTASDPMHAAPTQIEVCVGCHLAQGADLLKPSHHPLREGKMACTACHAPHGSSAPAELVHDTVNATCTACHAEFRGPFLWEHQPVTEDCSTCHAAHGSVQPALLTMRAPFLCQTCHEGAGHPSVASTPQGLAGGPSPSAFLLVGGCLNCHSQVHGSNHPSGRALMR